MGSVKSKKKIYGHINRANKTRRESFQKGKHDKNEVEGVKWYRKMEDQKKARKA